VLVTPDYEDGEQREYLIPKGKHIAVHEGDRVRAGEALMDGSSNPHDILRIEGEKELAKYLVDEVQEVYRLQGVKINDKHIEIDRPPDAPRVRVKEAGDTDFLVGEQVEKTPLFDGRTRAWRPRASESAKPSRCCSGITKASLSTESFISAASFQETTKVLTEAAIWGKTDHLHGLKENVIMGRLIPAGTAWLRYRTSGSRSRACARGAAGGLVGRPGRWAPCPAGRRFGNDPRRPSGHAGSPGRRRAR
jgi:DNA-directed RNA polymerase subunit beta'